MQGWEGDLDLRTRKGVDCPSSIMGEGYLTREHPLRNGWTLEEAISCPKYVKLMKWRNQ